MGEVEKYIADIEKEESDILEGKEPKKKKKAKIKKLDIISFGKLMESLKLDLRYDTRGNRVEINSKNPTTREMLCLDHDAQQKSEDGWTVVDDQLDAGIISLMEIALSQMSKGKVNLTPSKYKTYMLSMMNSSRYDRLMDWINNLPDWDGVERMHLLLYDFFGTERSDYIDWCSSFMMRGIVQRTMHPGSKLDHMLVLIGEKNLGKSSLCRGLLPEHLVEELFTDEVTLDMNAADLKDAIIGKTVVEFPEMIGMNDPKQLLKITAFLTKCNTKHRIRYTKYERTFPRTFILIGTTNFDVPFPESIRRDRRYLPVKVGSKVMEQHEIETYFAENREMLWAEAIAEWNTWSDPKYYPAWLPSELREEAYKAIEEHRYVNIEEQEALDEIALAMRVSNKQYWKHREIVDYVKEATGNRNWKCHQSTLKIKMAERGVVFRKVKLETGVRSMRYTLSYDLGVNKVTE